MAEHQWGPTFRCTNDGCTITLVKLGSKWWRRGGYGVTWRSTAIPPCTGKQLPDAGRDNSSEPRS